MKLIQKATIYQENPTTDKFIKLISCSRQGAQDKVLNKIMINNAPLSHMMLDVSSYIYTCFPLLF